MTATTWVPHDPDCTCATCALVTDPPPIFPKRDAWSTDPDRTTRRGDHR